MSVWRLTDELLDELVKYIEGGNYQHVACAAVGISQFTYREWRARGQNALERLPGDFDYRQHEEEYGEVTEEGPCVLPGDLDWRDWQCIKLVQRLRESEAKAEAYAVLMVRKHFPEQWTAAMTYLERRFPERWRKRQTIESVDGGQVIEGLDEDALITDGTALELLHEALERVAKGKEIAPAQQHALPAGAIEGQLVDSRDDHVTEDRPGG